jgi:hypothetical protein
VSILEGDELRRAAGFRIEVESGDILLVFPGADRSLPKTVYVCLFV